METFPPPLDAKRGGRNAATEERLNHSHGSLFVLQIINRDALGPYGVTHSEFDQRENNRYYTRIVHDAV